TEILPEPVTRVPPVYPESARRQGIEGAVVVKALVGMDGLVRNTTVDHSIPGLDEAAQACVRQWVFKPALSGGRPTAVWVSIPVTCRLHWLVPNSPAYARATPEAGEPDLSACVSEERAP